MRKKSPIDTYLNKLSQPQKSTLMSLRKFMAEMSPESTECISYGLPAFKYNGTVIGGFAATKKHCSYYPFSGSTLKTLIKALAEFEQTKSALHFPLDKPLSKKLVKLLVSTRIAEIPTKKQNSRTIKPGGVEQYIANCPKEIRGKLRDLRLAIRDVAPASVETVSYFDMPGYSYEGYEYNGMFAWFNFKAPYVRLHVRPVALQLYKKELKTYVKTKAIVSFPVDEPIPRGLVKKLVKSSLKAMMDLGKSAVEEKSR